MMVSREDFVEHYPQLLLEITIEADSPMGEPDGDNMATWQYPGIDICFKDLSLSIQVGENSINVVDKVTGRIRAKTMTALMGGSGAGKALRFLEGYTPMDILLLHLFTHRLLCLQEKLPC
jgi:ABC-type multidrug transport system fused ATPase/permease subunit